MAAAKWIVGTHFDLLCCEKTAQKNNWKKNPQNTYKAIIWNYNFDCSSAYKFENLMEWLILPLCFFNTFRSMAPNEFAEKKNLYAPTSNSPILFWVSHEMNVSLETKLDFKSFKCQWRVRNVIVCEIQISVVVCI